MLTSEFDFELPEDLIAQRPPSRRDDARMLVVHRDSGIREHRVFRELPDILGPTCFLVLNSTRVFPARLRATRPGKTGQIEILLVREESPRHWIALARPAHKARQDQQLLFDGGLAACVVAVRPDGTRLLRFEGHRELLPAFEQIGETPLPPYIRRDSTTGSDRQRYQTVYARHTGSIAAPTAGLHFTPQVFDRLTESGIEVCEVVLHVGYGTFQPVRTERIESHRMEGEYFEITEESASRMSLYRSQGRRLIAVGTTTTRVMEHLALAGTTKKESGFCDLFIYPGFRFRAVDGLLTNFHLPKSTLFMLVSAFAGTGLMRDAYREAISRRYRFFSYGDCMLIL